MFRSPGGYAEAACLHYRFRDKMASPNNILENMDELYGVKMTFQALSVALCGLQQSLAEIIMIA